MKKIYLLLLTLIISINSFQLSAQDTLTVADGTMTDFAVPFCGLFGGYYNRSQIFFPERLIEDMIGGDINSLTFYLSDSPANPWTSIFDVKLGVCSDTIFPSVAFLAVPTQTFYTGTMTVVSGCLTINFATPFPYNGGNLLVEFATQTPGNSSSAHFYGLNSPYSSIMGAASDALSSITPVSILSLNRHPFMPKTTFAYTPISLSCPKPDPFTVSDISAHEAQLSWSPGGNETSWDIYVTNTDLFPEDSVTPTASVTDTNYSLVALNPTTDYHVYIRANCGSEQSNWKGLSFHTLCDSVTTLPFIENFDTYGAGSGIYPECWNKINTYSILDRPYISGVCYNGVGSLGFTTNESGFYNIAIAPKIAKHIAINTLQANFMFRGIYNTDRIIVGVMSDPTDASTFVPVDTVYPGTPASTWVERTVIFSSYSGNGQHIAFKNEFNTSNTNTYVDNLVIELAPSCPRPQYVTLSNITADGCDVSWRPMGSENVWEVVAVPAGVAADSGTFVTAYSNPFTLTNLLDDTQFDVYVRANCGGSYSEWSLSATFTTDPLCTSALNVSVSQIAGASALVTWDDALYGAVSYKVGYSEVGQNSWTTQSVTGNHFMLSGLMPMTAYDVMVLSECALGSADTAFAQFSTICLAGGNVQIGDGTSTSEWIPIYHLWAYSLTEQIFLATEMNGPATIDGIAFEFVSEIASTSKNNVSIYLGHTTKSSFTGSYDYVPDSTLQLVYTGHLYCQPGWNTFPFDVPFHYNGIDNLVLVVDDNSGDSSGVSLRFRVHDSGTYYSTILYYTDSYSNNPDPSNPLLGNPINFYSRDRVNVRFFIPCDSTTACIAPNAYLSHIDENSLTITWAPGNMETSWEMQYCTDTANWISLDSVASPYTIDSLDFDTKYIVRLRAVCGNGEFSDWTTLEVRTPCSYISIPFYEDFEEAPGNGAGNMITCWTTSYTNGYPCTSNHSHSGGFSVAFSNSFISYLATPPFTDQTDMQNLRIRFWAEGPGWGYATMPYRIEIGVMTDPDDINTFVKIAETYPSTYNTWELLEVNTSNYTGNGRYIAFRTSRYTDHTVFIDDIIVDAIPCPQVTYITVDSANVTSSSANLNWTPRGDETQWKVVYGLSGSISNPEIESPTIVNDTPTIALCGLLPGSAYDVFVKSICSDTDSSTWAHYSFNTALVVTYETACESYCWHGTTYTVSGDYTYSHADTNGCTQVDTLHLTINNPMHTAVTATACGSFTWNDTEYTVSGDYTYSHPDTNGCTQVDTLHLTINNPVHTAVTATACESFTWNGTEYTITGDYTYSHPDTNGCAQVDTLHLTINNPVHTAVTETACESFTWNGTEYTVSGDYAYSNTDTNGCTQVDTLHLTIYGDETFEFTVVTEDSCYTWNAQTYCNSGSYTQTFQTIHDCDSVVTLHLTITVGIDDHDGLHFKVYPNPTNDIINVQCTPDNLSGVKIQIVDMYGKLVRTVETGSAPSLQRIDISDLAKGVYFLKLVADGKNMAVRKVVKQ